MYPEFVKYLEAESGLKIDLRSEGTIFFLGPDHDRSLLKTYPLPVALADLEPAFKIPQLPALFLQERSVDPRHLTAAAIAAARHQDVHFSSDDPVEAIEMCDRKAAGVRTSKTKFSAGIVVNCAGAWAGQIAPYSFPTRPVKGQMLSVILPEKTLVRHVVRTPEVYLIPRSNGTMVIGATLEEAGFDKRTVPETILKLRNAAIELVPRLADARILEDWAGLRPGTPDKLPILGETSLPGYFVATGHFRDGILLAPITARVMGQVIGGQKAEFDLKAFASSRF
jgi:glycine oxidase